MAVSIGCEDDSFQAKKEPDSKYGFSKFLPSKSKLFRPLMVPEEMFSGCREDEPTSEVNALVQPAAGLQPEVKRADCSPNTKRTAVDAGEVRFGTPVGAGAETLVLDIPGHKKRIAEVANLDLEAIPEEAAETDSSSWVAEAADSIRKGCLYPSALSHSSSQARHDGQDSASNDSRRRRL